MKTVGIIGGLGPETTSEFYLEIIFGCCENPLSPPVNTLKERSSLVHQRTLGSLRGTVASLCNFTDKVFYTTIPPVRNWWYRLYEKNKDNRPPILIWNVPIKYEIEKDLLTKAIGEKRYIPYLIDAAKKLEKAGADFIVMPCNSMHIFIEEIRKAVKIPVLSIVEETAKFLKNKIKIYDTMKIFAEATVDYISN